jgi:subtilisin family serine protease
VCDRVMDSANFVSTSSAVAALNHLTTLPDVRVVNMSWGGPAAGDSVLHDLIRAMRTRGVVFVASAGNEGHSIDSQPSYPAAWPEVIPVAMSNYQQNTLDPRSNWGRNCIAAPGGGAILTTKPGGGYDFFSGTSAAAPFVAAAASLLFSQGYSASEVEWRLRNGVDKPPSLSSVLGELNVEASFMLTAPALSAAFDQASYKGSEGAPVNISVAVSNPIAQTFIEFGDGTTASTVGSFNGSHLYPYGQFVAKATATAGGASVTVTSTVTITDTLDFKIKLKDGGKAKVSASSSRPDAVLTLTINGTLVSTDEPGYWVKKGVFRPAQFIIISSKGAQVVVNR